MKPIAILVLLAQLPTLFTYAQSSSTTHEFSQVNNVHAELGGHGYFYSINYERILLNADRFKTAAQVGIAYYPYQLGIRDFWIPIGINEIFSFKKHHIEAGVGFC